MAAANDLDKDAANGGSSNTIKDADDVQGPDAVVVADAVDDLKQHEEEAEDQGMFTLHMGYGGSYLQMWLQTCMIRCHLNEYIYFFN